jgi:uracil-DNA glycosylase
MIIYSNDEMNQILYDCLNIINSNETYIIKFLIDHNIHSSWYELFLNNSHNLVNILKDIDFIRNSTTIYPSTNIVFKVFEIDINQIKIVLLGQDPYINHNQAMGLSFSVPINTRIPPSLCNIFKEIKNEFPARKYNFTHGDLTKWSNNGVFLLNSALTVISGKSNSQQKLWSWFTDKTIQYINNKRSNIVFLLLGRNAIDKHIFINQHINKIVSGVHPSPYSAYNGFFDSNIFKKVESILDHDFDWSN